MCIWMLIRKNYKQLIVVFTFLILAFGIFGGYQTFQQIKLQKYAELYAYSNNLNFITLENTGSKSLYLQSYWINGQKQKNDRIKGSLIPPPAQGRSYSLEINQNLSYMEIQIFYVDDEGDNYRTNITAFKNTRKWEVYTLQQENLK